MKNESPNSCLVILGSPHVQTKFSSWDGWGQNHMFKSNLGRKGEESVALGFRPAKNSTHGMKPRARLAEMGVWKTPEVVAM